MVEYYNLSGYINAENPVDFMAYTDTLMAGMFSLFLILVIGIIITYLRIKRNEEPLNAIIYGSFFSLLVAIFLWVSGIIYSGLFKPGLYIFVPAVILVACSVIKWYNSR